MLPHIKAVIIDLDGTMIDTAPDFHIAVNRMRADLQLPSLSLRTIVNYVGKGTENLIRSVLSVDNDTKPVEQYFDQALSLYLDHYQQINGNHATVYPGVTEGLALMKKKMLRLACVTNKPRAFAVPLLEQKGLSSYFEVIYGGDSFPKKKPDPMPFLQVYEDFDVSPSQVVAIGDSSNDALAARAAGCHILSVPYGYNHGESVQNLDSDGIVQTLLEAAEQFS
ncbi:MAG TPA: phosphoglycolate phosphatase [Methyloradius sp.]